MATNREAMKNYHQIHSKIYYTTKVLTSPLTLINHSVGGTMGFAIGESVGVRVEEYDWGQQYTAYVIISGKCYSLTKTVGVVPVVNDKEIEGEILTYILKAQ